jgi:hypothetical protein
MVHTRMILRSERQVTSHRVPPPYTDPSILYTNQAHGSLFKNHERIAPSAAIMPNVQNGNPM